MDKLTAVLINPESFSDSAVNSYKAPPDTKRTPGLGRLLPLCASALETADSELSVRAGLIAIQIKGNHYSSELP